MYLCPMGKRIYIDLDDTLCMYTAIHNECTKANPKNQYPQSEYGFYLRLPVMWLGLESIHKLDALGFDIWLLSRPSFKNPMCYTEKRVWVEKRLGEKWVERLILAPDKSLFIGDYLIDDHPWPDFQGEQLLFGSKEFPDWKTTVDYLLKQNKI